MRPPQKADATKLPKTLHRELREIPMCYNRGGEAKRALRLSLLDLGSSRVREKSGRPGDLRRMAWEPAGSLRVAGALPRNLPSTKISAASGSEVMVSCP